VKISGDPRESAGKAFGINVLRDLPHRSKPGIPRGTRMVLSECLDQILEQHVGHAGEVRRGDAGVAISRARAIEHGDAESRPLEQICGSDSGNARTHDHDVRVKVPVE